MKTTKQDLTERLEILLEKYKHYPYNEFTKEVIKLETTEFIHSYIKEKIFDDEKEVLTEIKKDFDFDCNIIQRSNRVFKIKMNKIF